MAEVARRHGVNANLVFVQGNDCRIEGCWSSTRADLLRRPSCCLSGSATSPRSPVPPPPFPISRLSSLVACALAATVPWMLRSSSG